MTHVPALQMFLVFLRLGLTSFGGPVAHIGYFRDEFVTRRNWLEEKGYADLVALCQFLPGPASSQTGIGIGLIKGGLPGALAAWAGFTLPSALALLVVGLGVTTWGDGLDGGGLRGLKIVAVAVVAQAVWGMGRSLCPDAKRATLAGLAAIAVLAVPTAWGQVGAIIVGGIAGMLLLKAESAAAPAAFGVRIGKGAAIVSLALFFLLLGGLPLVAAATGSGALDLFDSFYRSGSLVFGGGHVVLPLLKAEVVPPGWVSENLFLAGYGAAQAVPGPLFTFAAYLGAVTTAVPDPFWGAAVCLVAIFLPSFLLVAGTLPFWDDLRRFAVMQRALLGVNAAVVGLLLAALYDPVWTGGVRGPADFAVALAAFGLLVFWKTPPWLVVILTALSGAGLSMAGI